MKSRLSGSVAHPPSVRSPENASASGAEHRSSGGNVSELLQHYLREQHAAIVHADVEPGVTGTVDDPAVKAVRRLEAVLHVFDRCFDARQAARLSQELAWIGFFLSEVSDRESLADRVAVRLARLSGDLVLGPVAANIEWVLSMEKEVHLGRLQEATHSERYQQFLVLLSEWQRTPHLTRKADQPAATIDKHLSRAVDEFDRRLASAVLEGKPEALSRARRTGQQLRYATEVSARLSRKVTRSVERVRQTESVLQEHAVSVRAADFLARVGLAVGMDTEHNGFTYGLLYEQELRQATALLGRLEKQR